MTKSRRKSITVYEVALHNGVIEQLKLNDSDNESLKQAINDYIDNDLPDDEEIFYQGNDYVVTEKAVYIAEYD